MAFLYSRPDEGFMFGAVTGTVEDTYNANWLVNGQPGYPVRGTTGLSLSVTALASRSVGLVAVVNHNLTGAVTIGGGVTATVPAATWGADDIAFNSWTLVSPPATSSTLTLAVTQTPSIIGELYAGKVRSLQRTLQTQPDFDPGEPFEWEGESGGLAPYDPGAESRRLAGETIVNDSGLADIEAWYQSTRKGTRPTLIVPIDARNDAWLVTFRYRWRPVLMGVPGRSSIHRVSFEFAEIPRLRWP